MFHIHELYLYFNLFFQLLSYFIYFSRQAHNTSLLSDNPRLFNGLPTLLTLGIRSPRLVRDFRVHIYRRCLSCPHYRLPGCGRLCVDACQPFEGVVTFSAFWSAPSFPIATLIIVFSSSLSLFPLPSSPL